MFYYSKLLIIIIAIIINNAKVESKNNVDFKIITAIRHGLNQSLNYIEENLKEVTLDCLLGVTFTQNFLIESYKNGTHIMDDSTIKLIKKTRKILKKSEEIFKLDWKYDIINTTLWENGKYYEKYLENNLKKLPNKRNNLFNQQIIPSSDECLKEIIESTKNTINNNNNCKITLNCWNGYFKDPFGDNYYLTHKLLILQIARARKCLISYPKNFYSTRIRKICSLILNEIELNDQSGNLELIFDLFLEQVTLCGYERFMEFIQNLWIYRILKAQHANGCFSANLLDPLKSRLKRNFRFFKNGCNDHTTGLGAAVLSLYYNYLINHESLNYN